MKMRRENPIIVALDVFTRKEAEKLVDELIGSVSIFKVGHQLFLREGFDIVRMIRDKGGEVFLDLKFHDIPSVIANAVEVAFKEKVYMLTLHSLGGKAMLSQVVEKVGNLKGRKPFLLGVTFLTSLGESDLSELGFSLSMKEEVLKLATMCKDCGLDGIVCSGQEISLIRERFKENFLVVTPGVRLYTLPYDDQKRTISVEDAIRDGADYLVMGRSITGSREPKKQIETVLEKLNKL